jgi:hypothetical protein
VSIPEYPPSLVNPFFLGLTHQILAKIIQPQEGAKNAQQGTI